MVVITGKRGKYEVLGQLGKGGQATVYKAQDPDQPGKLYALKVVHIRGWEDESVFADEAYQRFHWEYLLTTRLRHPQISTASDYGIDKGNKVVFMARPYIEGNTLTELINLRGPFPLGDGNRIILSLAGVLEYIHSMDIIHCDMKPSNVFMELGDPILIDFGLVAGKDSPKYFVGGTSGTMAYLAPEVLDQSTKEMYRYSPTRDWWGLGCIAFDIFTGRRLFKNTESNILRRDIDGGLARLTVENVLDGHPAKHLVNALLQRDPTKRVASRKVIQKIITAQ